MNIETFWTIVDAGKDDEAPEVRLERALGLLTPEEIVSFQEHFDDLFFAACRWELWGAAYLIEGGCSDDGFTDFRYALISKGRAVYESALTDADSLSDTEIVSNELFGYAAGKVYEKKTGREMPRRERRLPQVPEGTKWDFDDAAENAERLPRVWQRFGG